MIPGFLNSYIHMKNGGCLDLYFKKLWILINRIHVWILRQCASPILNNSIMATKKILLIIVIIYIFNKIITLISLWIYYLYCCVKRII